MDVNDHPPGDPPVQQHQSSPTPIPADQVLAELGLKDADGALRAQVDRFIKVNGFSGVLLAARYTADRLDRVKNPWAYTIQVFNGNLARLTMLYVLVHWVETGLRSRVELAMRTAAGDRWFDDPAGYIPTDEVRKFETDKSQSTTWRPDRTTGRMVPNHENGVAFLETVGFGWLARIVHRVYHPHLFGVLIRGDGSKPTLDEVDALLRECNTARRVVAHNGYVDDKGFIARQRAARRMLELLAFDVGKALARFEPVRRRVFERYLANVNHPDLTADPQGLLDLAQRRRPR